MRTLCYKFVLFFVAVNLLLLPYSNPHGVYAQAAEPCTVGPHSGIIDSDQTWCAVGSPHLLSGDVTINTGVVLTIEAGVEVRAVPGAGLVIQGQLSAIGEAAQPIIFTHDGGGRWSGLLFSEGYGILRYVQLDHAVDAQEGITEIAHILARNVQAGELVIEDSLLAEGQSGLDLTNSRVILRNTTFRNMTAGSRYPLYIRGATSRLTMSGNTFESNYTNRIWLGADALNGADATLAPQTGIEAYYLHDGYTVPNGVTFTILPGVKVITRSSDSYTTRSMVINGHMSAIGTQQQPIVFTSVADNGPSQWAGLNFTGGTGQLEYVSLRNVGQMYEGSYDVALLVADTPADGWVRFEHSTLTNTSEDAIRIVNGRARIADSVIRDTSLGGDTYRSAIMINGVNSVVDVTGNTFTNNATAVSMVDTEHVTITNNIIVDSHGWLGAVRAERSSVFIRGNRIENSDQDGIALSFAGGTVSENMIRGSGRSAIMLSNAYDNTPATILNNNVLIENAELGSQYAGVRVQVAPAVLTGAHNTIARNAGAGVYVSAGKVTLTNTILAENILGAQGGGSLTLNNTLFDNNTTDTAGSMTNNQPLIGASAFAADGYHLTADSQAIGVGAATSLATDIDGEPRPSPAGSQPDLGADEFIDTPASELDSSMVALAPQWFAVPDPIHGVSAGVLHQRYVLRLNYNADPTPPAAVATLTDTFPADLAFSSEEHSPDMNVSVQGNQVQWQTQSPLQPGDTAAAWLNTIDSSPQPGQVLVNTADFTVGTLNEHFEISTTVPVMPPLISFPGNGEICAEPDGSLTVQGGAQPATTVILYEDGVEKGRATLPLDGNGVFEITYPDSHAGAESTTLTARACSLSNPGACSETGQPVELRASQSFWCPQRSHWANSSHFHSGGEYSTQNWGINGAIGGPGSDLYLYACKCPGTGATPTNVRVEASGVTYLPVGDTTAPMYHFAVGFNHREMAFVSDCGISAGRVLIDPDGFVFDVTKGFDPDNPTLNAVEGVRVTAYVEMPEWGGWVPWPAHLYENQQNPQTTGEIGYFAFFTPPGRYYLQVDGIAGFQPWRSPVVEVVDEIVHVNVPYTPWADGEPVQVDLTSSGPQPATVSVPIGSSVEWAAGIPPTDEELIQLTNDPTLLVSSDLNPIENTLGWNSGMLAPARVYRRNFTEPGTYSYSDGNGHTGTVEVPPAPNTPPAMNLTQPASNISRTQGDSLTIQWSDSDPDDNAAISLAYDVDSDPSNGNHTLITSSLTEDPDGAEDQHVWNTGGAAPGTYYLWGKIDDGHNPPVYALAAGRLTITAVQSCYTLNLSASPSGSGTLSANMQSNCADVRYTQGTQIQLTASPAAGYSFDHWSGSASGSVNPITISMDADKAVVANFTAVCYTLTTTISPTGSGKISANTAPDCNAGTQYAYGTSVQLTASANAGYTFAKWTGSATGTVNPVRVTMTADRSVTANFTAASTCPTPVIKAILPIRIRVRSANVQMTIIGSGFTAGSVVRWNGSVLSEVKYVSPTTLKVGVPFSLLLRPGKASVTVVNPGPCAAISKAVSIDITEQAFLYIPVIAR